jgi:lipopolysaccharide export system protein LptA
VIPTPTSLPRLHPRLAVTRVARTLAVALAAAGMLPLAVVPAAGQGTAPAAAATAAPAAAPADAAAAKAKPKAKAPAKASPPAAAANAPANAPAKAAAGGPAGPGALRNNPDRDQPINYSADSGDVNYQTKVGALTGNVVITQGSLAIRADRISFKQNADNSLAVTAFGNPVTFRQKRPGTDEWFEGYAQRAEYDGAKELLELFDNALLRRGQDEIRSNYISYNAATELFKAEGRATTQPLPDDPGARVRGVFQPRSDALPGKGTKDAADKGTAPAAAPPASPAPALQSAPELGARPPAAK